jgi:hypothetical protein
MSKHFFLGDEGKVVREIGVGSRPFEAHCVGREGWKRKCFLVKGNLFPASCVYLYVKNDHRG